MGNQAIGISHRFEAIRLVVGVDVALAALVAALKGLGVGAFAFSSPYVASLNDLAVAFIEAFGLRCVGRADALKPLGNNEVAALTPADVLALAEQADCGEAEAIVLSCTDMRAVEAVPAIEERLGKPVVTSNLALAWQALRTVGCTRSMPDFGQLFR